MPWHDLATEIAALFVSCAAMPNGRCTDTEELLYRTYQRRLARRREQPAPGSPTRISSREREWRHAYNARAHVREKQRAKNRAYRERPGVKERLRAQARAYLARPEVRARRREIDRQSWARCRERRRLAAEACKVHLRGCPRNAFHEDGGPSGTPKEETE